MTELKKYYIERTDVSYCTIMAHSKEDAIKRSGNGMLEQNWHTDVGEETVVLIEDDLEDTEPFHQNGFREFVPEPKFKVGDRVFGDFDRTTKLGTVILQYGSGGEWFLVEWDDGTTNSVSIHSKYSDNVRLATPDDREWRSGPPPHIGWWNASNEKWNDIWRWWNGSSWSQHVSSHTNAKHAHGAAMWATTDKNILWSNYWPENARVPRINPNKE